MGREEENRTIEENIDLVYKIAALRFSIWRNDDDLIQAGLIGLWEAAKTWNGTGSFKGFANTAIYHNMLDYVRAKTTHTQQTWEIDENTVDTSQDLECADYDLIERIKKAWPAGSKERDVLLQLVKGTEKRLIAEQMKTTTARVTKVAKRAIKRVLAE